MNDKEINDKVSLESYISLTLSNSKSEVTIKSNEILIIPDATSTSEQTALKILLDDNDTIESERCEVECKNKIWDGQALLDQCGAEAMWVDGEGNFFYSPGFQEYIKT